MAAKRKPRGEVDFPIAARAIMQDYEDFVTAGPDDGATKAFAARHAAARTALAHLEQLLKLVNELGSAEDAKEINASITEWRARMPPQALEETEAHDEGTGG